MSNEILTSLIVTLGGVVAAFITVRVRRSKPRAQYIDTAFEAYEAIMRRQDDEIKRKDVQIAELVAENARLRGGIKS